MDAAGCSDIRTVELAGTAERKTAAGMLAEMKFDDDAADAAASARAESKQSKPPGIHGTKGEEDEDDDDLLSLMDSA